MNEPTTPTNTFTRRHILAGAAVIGAGLVAAACGNDKQTETTSVGTGDTAGTTPTSMAPSDTTMAPDTTMGSDTTMAADPGVDLKVATLAAGLEVLAVGTYKAALDAAGAGSLGEVPAAVGEFVTVAMAQHQEHLDAWNSVLAAAGQPEVTEPDATLKPVVDKEFGAVKDVAGAATLALMLEQIAAATYLNAQSVLTNKDAIKLAGSIQIIDAQHASILLYVLGKYPVPDTFAKVDMAAA